MLQKAIMDVRRRMEEAARRAGRQASDVRLMAVTKTLPRETVLQAIEAGLSLFGENRVQEAEEKYAEMPGGYELHLIGHLQRNKARAASGLFTCVQSIDKVETAEALDARCADRGVVRDVLLELNTSAEESKSGFRSRDGLLRALEALAALSHLRVRGLMTVGPLCDEEGRIRASFSALRSLYEELRSGGGLPGFDTLSMGMSGDFELAIEEGSTLIRVGTALFGARNGTTANGAPPGGARQSTTANGAPPGGGPGVRMRQGGRVLAVLLLLLVAGGLAPAAAADTTTAEHVAQPYTADEFAPWMRSLWRAEAIFVGSLPFTMFMVFEAYDTYRYAVVGEFQDVSYAPWPIGTGATYSVDETMWLAVSAISASLLVATVDFIIDKVNESKKR